jgi:hypothetical protein
MNERPIQVGDLVQVVRSCCDRAPCYGDIFTVGAIRESFTQCSFCRSANRGLHGGTRIEGNSGVGGVPLEWLKRFPPLEELEGQRTEESLREPKRFPTKEEFSRMVDKMQEALRR